MRQNFWIFIYLFFQERRIFDSGVSARPRQLPVRRPRQQSRPGEQSRESDLLVYPEVRFASLSRSQSYDHELQRQRRKNLQRY
jgi:hypothetical protein